MSPSGRYVAVHTLDREGSVHKVDLTTGVSTLVAKGEQIGNPWPAFSPSGDRLAWMEARTGMQNPPAIRVQVEGGPTVDAGGRSLRSFKWLDEATMLLITSDDELIVVDVASNAERVRLRRR